MQCIVIFITALHENGTNIITMCSSLSSLQRFLLKTKIANVRGELCLPQMVTVQQIHFVIQFEYKWMRLRSAFYPKRLTVG